MNAIELWSGKSENGHALRVRLLRDQTILVEMDAGPAADGKSLWVAIDSEVRSQEYETAVEECIVALATAGHAPRQSDGDA